MSLSADDIRWVAHLARLEIDQTEIEALTKQLGAIIDYVQLLQSVDTTNVEPFAHPIAIQNVFREDVETASLPVDAALANAPQRQGDFYRVPAVFE